jgi:exodeoxyribonuclease V alpha subunit
LETQFTGCVTTVIFSNPLSNYAVLLLRQADAEKVITGPLADCVVGDYLFVEGDWVSHPVHKKQFKVRSYAHLVPKTNEELTLFLSSGVVSGVGPHFAKTLVATFGDDLVSILDQCPERLLGVPGIGQKKVTAIASSWKLHREQLSFLQFLTPYDVTVQLAKRIWNTYYLDAFDVCKYRPFQLIQDVNGVDFKLADLIAGDSHQFTDARLDAAIDDVFQSFYQTSHVWMPFDDFFKQLNQRLSMDEEALMDQLQRRFFSQMLSLVIDGDHRWITLATYSDAELSIMNAVDAMMSAPASVQVQSRRAVDWVLPRLTHTLSVDQIEALEGVCEHSVSILYGGPGTGKTSLLRAYVEIVSKKTDRILLMAPTGKAAKRLAEQVGRRASTVHAMMDVDEKSHALTPKPLDVDVCIIDEMSMVDMSLFQDIMTMLSPGTRLLLVGDPDQLPSIGPGQVFYDMIHYSNIPTYQLTTNHRQVTHQGITSLAHHILNRDPIPSRLGDDLTLIHTNSDDELEMMLLDLFLNKAIADHQVHLNDIQLIVPIHKGRFGISNLNQTIAKEVRPSMSYSPWVAGDRVIQCRNNYSKRVMNGDIGFIRSMSNDSIKVQFHHDTVEFEPTDMQDIQLAYAVSIHKFQGSEAPIIILPIVKQWGFFMSMDVLYTAVTRAKAHLYVLGDMTVFNQMVINSKKSLRHTRLFQL